MIKNGVTDNSSDSAFTGAWVKYLRLEKGYTQGYVAHGICSISHLSYFENGKKKLHDDQIATVLKKLDVSEMTVPKDIQHIHTIMENMLTHIEDYDCESSTNEYEKLKVYEDVLKTSPFWFEYKVYSMIYLYFVKGKLMKDQASDIQMLDEIYESFPDNLRFWYLFISGTIYARDDKNDKGIERLKKAAQIRKTTWLYYITGVALSCSNDKGQAIFNFEKALDNYETGGRFQSAVWCKSYLGCCYSELGMFD